MINGMISKIYLDEDWSHAQIQIFFIIHSRMVGRTGVEYLPFNFPADVDHQISEWTPLASSWASTCMFG